MSRLSEITPEERVINAVYDAEAAIAALAREPLSAAHVEDILAVLSGDPSDAFHDAAIRAAAWTSTGSRVAAAMLVVTVKRAGVPAAVFAAAVDGITEALAAGLVPDEPPHRVPDDLWRLLKAYAFPAQAPVEVMA